MGFFRSVRGITDSFDVRMLLDQYSSTSSTTSTRTCSGRCHQERTLMVLPIISGCVSVVGSSLILYMIATHPTSAHVKRRQGRLQRGGASKLTYERIMIGLTCADFINSLQSIVAPFAATAGSPGFWYASGTQATCTAQGFLLVVGSSTSYYSAALAIFFVLSMILTVSDDTIKHWIEPFLHGVSISVPAVFAIVGLFLNLYNPSPEGDGCSFAPYPNGCDQLGDTSSCTRGQETEQLTTYLLGFIFISFCIIVVCMVTLYMMSWLQHRKMKSLYSITATVTSNENITSARTNISTAGGSSLRTSFFSRPSMINSENGGNHQISIFQRNAIAEQQEQDRKHQNGNNRKLIRIATQGLLYIFSYLVTWIWTFLLVAFWVTDKQGWYSTLVSTSKIPTYLFAVRVIQKTFNPLQGFWNFFIYIRPRFIDLRRQPLTTISRYEALRIIIFNSPTTSQANTARSNQQQNDRFSHCSQALLHYRLCRKPKESSPLPVATIANVINNTNIECSSDASIESNELKKKTYDADHPSLILNNKSNIVSDANVDVVHQEQSETSIKSESCDDDIVQYNIGIE